MRAILPMAHITKLKIAYIYIMAMIIALMGGFVAFAFGRGIESVASFEIGFIGFMLIMGSSFCVMLKRTRLQIATAQNIESSKDIESMASRSVGSVDAIKSTESTKIESSTFYAHKHRDNEAAQQMADKDAKAQADKVSLSTRFVIGTRMSLSLLRIMCYVIFALLFILLLKYQLLSLIWFSLGLSVAIVCIIGVSVYAIMRTSS